MKREPREIESIVLAMFAAIPLYFSRALSPAAVGGYQAILGLLLLRIFQSGRRPVVGTLTTRFFAIGYLLFFFFDALAISRSMIRASSHLLFFIVVYLVLEQAWKENAGKRLLVTFLIFIASIATSTHLAIVLFIMAFAFLAFREMMQISHATSAELAPGPQREQPTARAAVGYMAAACVFAVLLFPVLPRVRNPVVRGMGGTLGSATTGISDLIDFRRERSISANPQVVARVSMRQEMIPFFTPLRLRATVYDSYRGGAWRAKQSFGGTLDRRGDSFLIARREGFAGEATVQQQVLDTPRLFLPVGTYSIRGLPVVVGDPEGSVYAVSGYPRDAINYKVSIAWRTRPLEKVPPQLIDYPISPEILNMARSMVGTSTDALSMAAKIESQMSREFRYVANPADLGRPISVDEFLLERRRGHCEYFAAGMVVLMTSLNVPARVVGGFYGGELNPLTGYFVVRQRDAHAWVEIFDGDRWVTFDPTPATDRPGTSAKGWLGAYLTALGDSITYFWDRYVLTFGLTDQVSILLQLLETGRDATHVLRQQFVALVRSIGFWLSLAAATLMIGVVAMLARARRRRRSPFNDLVQRLAKLGIEVPPAMTADELQRFVRENRPELLEHVDPVLRYYTKARFAPEPPTAEERAAARFGLRQLRAMKA